MNYKTGQPLPWRRRFAEGIRILKSHFNNNKSKSVNEAQEEIQNLIDRFKRFVHQLYFKQHLAIFTEISFLISEL